MTIQLRIYACSQASKYGSVSICIGVYLITHTTAQLYILLRIHACFYAYIQTDTQTSFANSIRIFRSHHAHYHLFAYSVAYSCILPSIDAPFHALMYDLTHVFIMHRWYAYNLALLYILPHIDAHCHAFIHDLVVYSQFTDNICIIKRYRTYYHLLMHSATFVRAWSYVFIQGFKKNFNPLIYQ